MRTISRNFLDMHKKPFFVKFVRFFLKFCYWSLSLTPIVLFYPITESCSEILHKVDVIENLRFRSHSYDGKHFIFTRYDQTGNQYELVFYNLKEKKMDYLVPNLSSSTEYLFSDNRFVFVKNRERPGDLCIIEKDAPSNRKILDLGNNGISQVFLIANRLFIFQKPNFNKCICLTYDFNSLKPFSTKVIEKASIFHQCGQYFIGIGEKTIVYDQEMDMLYQIQNNLPCQLGMSGTIDDKLYFADICGKFSVYNPKDNTRQIITDLEGSDLPSKLHRYSSLMFDVNNDGILVAVHSNKESYPKLIDTKADLLLATLETPIIPDHIMIDENQLYFIYASLEKKNKIEIYTINWQELHSENFFSDRLSKAHTKALDLYHSTKDVHRAIEILERADIVSMINGKRKTEVDFKVRILNDYAFFLSMTYERYQESMPLFDEVIRLSPNRANAYLNIADVYYKHYQFDGHDPRILKKAIENYEQYCQKMGAKQSNKKPLHRVFAELQNEPKVKQLAIDNQTIIGDALIWKNYLFLTTDNSDGPIVNILDRDNYTFLSELKIIADDDDFQDDIYSMKVIENKLVVNTAFRWEDENRPNYFVFDLIDFKKIEERHKSDKNESTDFFGLDISLASTKQTELLQSISRSGKNFDQVHGRYETNNHRFLVTKSGTTGYTQFNIYDLISPQKSQIDLMRPNARCHLFDQIDQMVITYFTSTQTLIELYDLISQDRRWIFSLENFPGGLVTITPHLKTYKHYLIIFHKNDLLIFDTLKMTVIKVIRNVIPDKYLVEDKSGCKIYHLFIDPVKKRLLIFTLRGCFNGVLDLEFLD